MDIVKFELWHMRELVQKPTQENLMPMMINPAYQQALAAGDSWTLIHDGVVIGSAGLMQIWPGLSHAWASISAASGPAGMLRMTRAVRRMLAIRDGRIEAYVAAEFEAAHHWMAVLGFERETPNIMRKWFPDGSGAVLYARVI